MRLGEARGFRALARELLQAARGTRGVHLDVGGEGRYARAINLNPGELTSTTGTAGRPIPNLVKGFGEDMPIASHSVALLTLESAPVRSGTAAEIARVLKPGGVVYLLHPADYAVEAHARVAAAVGGPMTQARHGELLLSRVMAPGPNDAVAGVAQLRSSTAP